MLFSFGTQKRKVFTLCVFAYSLSLYPQKNSTTSWAVKMRRNIESG